MIKDEQTSRQMKNLHQIQKNLAYIITRHEPNTTLKTIPEMPRLLFGKKLSWKGNWGKLWICMQPLINESAIRRRVVRITTLVQIIILNYAARYKHEIQPQRLHKYYGY